MVNLITEWPTAPHMHSYTNLWWQSCSPFQTVTSFPSLVFHKVVHSHSCLIPTIPQLYCPHLLFTCSFVIVGKDPDRAEVWTPATERITFYCTWRPSALTTGHMGRLAALTCSWVINFLDCLYLSSPLPCSTLDVLWHVVLMVSVHTLNSTDDGIVLNGNLSASAVIEETTRKRELRLLKNR